MTTLLEIPMSLGSFRGDDSINKKCRIQELIDFQYKTEDKEVISV